MQKGLPSGELMLARRTKTASGKEAGDRREPRPPTVAAGVMGSEADLAGAGCSAKHVKAGGGGSAEATVATGYEATIGGVELDDTGCCGIEGAGCYAEGDFFGSLHFFHSIHGDGEKMNEVLPDIMVSVEIDTLVGNVECGVLKLFFAECLIVYLRYFHCGHYDFLEIVAAYEGVASDYLDGFAEICTAQIVATHEGALADGLNCVGETKIFQSAAELEATCSHFFATLLEFNFGKHSAMVEGPTHDYLAFGRDVDSLQTIAILESSEIDFLHVGGDKYFRDLVATIEGTIPYTFDIGIEGNFRTTLWHLHNLRAYIIIENAPFRTIELVALLHEDILQTCAELKGAIAIVAERRRKCHLFEPTAAGEALRAHSDESLGESDRCEQSIEIACQHSYLCDGILDACGRIGHFGGDHEVAFKVLAIAGKGASSGAERLEIH